MMTRQQNDSPYKPSRRVSWLSMSRIGEISRGKKRVNFGEDENEVYILKHMSTYMFISLLTFI